MKKLFFSTPFLIMLFVLSATYFLQTKITFSGDVGYLLNVSNQMLNGAHYGYEIFETNPPMILYFYLPIVLLNKITGMDIMLLLRLYILFLACSSVSVCYYLIKKIVNPEDTEIAYSIYFALIFVEFFLPVDEFGQREHLLIILTLPYFFSSVLFIKNIKNSMPLRFIIGFSAAFSFALKPFFLVPLILIELYIILKKKSLFGWIRMETIIILSVLIIYLASVFMLQPGYLKIILPLVTYFYFIGVQNDWLLVICNNVTALVFICFALWFFIKKEDPYHSLSTVLLLATIGMMIAFVIPRTYWYYQVMPSLGFSFLFIAYIYGVLIRKPQYSHFFYLTFYRTALLMSCLLLLYFPFSQVLFRYDYFLFNKKYLAEEKNLTEQLKNMNDVQKIFCFSANTTRDCFPLAYNAHKNFTSSFPFYWWLRGMLALDKDQLPVTAKNKKTLIDKAADDLNEYKPDVIIFYEKQMQYVVYDKFDLIAYLSQNEKFQKAWQHYYHLRDVGLYKIYKRNDRE